MSKGMSRQERQIRIELARTRAALERQNMARALHELHDSFTPAGLWQSLFSSGSKRGTSGPRVSWVSQIFALSRRYPFLLTGVSAALSSLGRGRGRSRWVWRLGLGALAGWRVLQGIQRRNDRETSSAVAITRSPR